MCLGITRIELLDSVVLYLGVTTLKIQGISIIWDRSLCKIILIFILCCLMMHPMTKPWSYRCNSSENQTSQNREWHTCRTWIAHLRHTTSSTPHSIFVGKMMCRSELMATIYCWVKMCSVSWMPPIWRTHNYGLLTLAINPVYSRMGSPVGSSVRNKWSTVKEVEGDSTLLVLSQLGELNSLEASR